MSTKASVVVVCVVLFCVFCAAVAYAAELTIERICSDPSLSGLNLREIKVSPEGSKVAFLKNRASDSERYDLWVYYVAERAARLTVNCDSIVVGAETLSDEEKAHRERMRVFATGIVEYSWSHDGRRLLFTLDGDVYSYDLTKPAAEAMTALTRTPDFESDARFSPKDHFASFIRADNVFVIDLASRQEKQLTSDGKGLIKNGVAEFVAQEEMSRYTGYWWSDDEASIAIEQTDENPVGIEERFEIYADTFKVVEERYPRAGTPNAIVRIGVVNVSDGRRTWMDLGDNTDVYVARVDWLPDSRQLAVQRESRDQKVLDLVLCDALTGKSRVALTETSETWINLTDDLTFLKKNPMFVWSSERSGYRHLYLYDLEGRLVRQLTSGDWVVGEVTCVDEKKGNVYFTGFAKGPLQQHLYCVSLSGKAVERPQQVTTGEGWHGVVVDDRAEFFVDRFSNLHTPPQVSVRRMNGALLGFLEENKVDSSHPYYPYAASQSPTEFGTLEAADGSPLCYMLTRPTPFDPGRNYPAVVYVYGGPGFQLVTEEWGGRTWLWVQYMAQHGYVVFLLDNRGTANRGKAFEDAIYHRMGKAEVEDQVRGASFLKSLPYVDSTRIGVFGHSYGGYMTLMSMTTAPGVFKAGVAASPVTDWSLYDTHYTERYLGKPQENSEGYGESGVLAHVDDLKGNLLVIHGMADDNVLFMNSVRLFKALQDRGILFDEMTYPGSKHSLSGKTVQTHYYRTLSRFFDERL